MLDMATVTSQALALRTRDNSSENHARLENSLLKYNIGARLNGRVEKSLTWRVQRSWMRIGERADTKPCEVRHPRVPAYAGPVLNTIVPALRLSRAATKLPLTLQDSTRIRATASFEKRKILTVQHAIPSHLLAFFASPPPLQLLELAAVICARIIGIRPRCRQRDEELEEGVAAVEERKEVGRALVVAVPRRYCGVARRISGDLGG